MLVLQRYSMRWQVETHTKCNPVFLSPLVGLEIQVLYRTSLTNVVAKSCSPFSLSITAAT